MIITADTMHRLRKVYRLTQAELGALCGVSDAFINQIERGKRNVTERIARAINTEFELTQSKLARIIEIYDETNFNRGRGKTA
jgi:transcriptional regulator with XRE-family HTH domain